MYLALEGGPSGFPRGFTCPAVLGNLSRESSSFNLRGFHPLWQTFPGPSTRIKICNSPARLQSDQDKPHNPGLTTPVSLHKPGLGYSPFARRYLGNRGFFLFLGVLRCFSSPGRLYPPYIFRWKWHGMTRARFPDSEISGSKPVIGSPKLIADYHVLHRHLTPRHPPYALRNLTISCF